MDIILLSLIVLGFAGFIIGLAGKSQAVKSKSFRRNEFYQRITIVSLVLMLISAVIYSFIA